MIKATVQLLSNYNLVSSYLVLLYVFLFYIRIVYIDRRYDTVSKLNHRQ